MHLLQVFVSAAYVPEWLRVAISLGGTGGHVFIFCSGFGLYLSYLKKPVGFCTFMQNRFLKIYVPYILFIFVEFCLWQNTNRQLLIRQLLSHVFLYKMFYEKYIISFGLQFWFLSTIFQLYFLFLPLCLFRKRFSLRALILLGIGLSIIWWILMEITGLGEKRIWGSFCLQYLWEFVMGMAAAEYLICRKSIRVPLLFLWIFATTGLTLQALMALKGGWFAAFNDVPALFGYGSAALLLWYYGKRLVRTVFLQIDSISYEWFLVHTTVFTWLYRLFRPHMTSEVLLALLAVILSLIVAWIYARFLRLVLQKHQM